MSFDDEVDELKRDLRTKRLSPEDNIEATQELEDLMREHIGSRRLKFEYDFDEEDGPRIEILYSKAPFHIGTIWVHPDGSIAFASESEYFPPIAAFDNEEEFLMETRQFLMEGLAAFELDEEDDAYET